MKYIILEIQGNYAAACSEDGRFVKLKNNGYKVGQEIKAELRARNIPRVAVAACLAFLIVSGGVSAWAYLTPFSYISIDVNPSVRLSANFFDRILNSTAMNDDGEVILGDLDLRNKTIQDAVLLTVQEMIEQNYISSGEENNQILISAYSHNNTHNQELTDQLGASVRTCMNDEMIPATVASESVDSQQVEQADELGVSTGKLKIAQELLTLTQGQYSLDELLDMSVKELMQIRKEKKETCGGQANADEEKNNENASENANKGNKQQSPSPVVLPSIKQDPSPEIPSPKVTIDNQNNAGGNKDTKANPASDKERTNSEKDTDEDEAADTSQ